MTVAETVRKLRDWEDYVNFSNSVKKEESAECWRCFAWNRDIVQMGGLPATVAECYERTLCAEFRLNQMKAKKLRSVKTEQEGRT